MHDSADIIADTKTFRRDLDKVLQRIKNVTTLDASITDSSGKPAQPMGYRSSRERSLAVTKLQEAIMWLGMDLKAIAEENPQPEGQASDSETLGRNAYMRYGAVTDFKNFLGNPMPTWSELPEKTRTAWIAAVTIPTQASTSNPYPESYNPSSSVIEKTADGLKL
jgi:hypothetical protein